MVTYPGIWREVPLSEVADVRDGTHASPQYVSYGYPLVTSKNLKNGKIDWNDIQYISRKDFDEINKRSKVDPNDILMGMIGTIGNIAMIPNKCDFAIKNVALIKDVQKSNMLYLYYYLQSKNATDQLTDQADGGNQKFIALNKIRNFSILLPPSELEQDFIAETLLSFDEYIDNLTELIEKKKAIRDGALEDLVSGRTRVDGFSGEWETVDLSDFTQINPSSEIPEEFYYVDLESVKGISLTNARKENKKTAPSRAKRLAKRGDVFFQTVRPYQKNNYLFDLKKENYVFSTGYAQLRTINDSQFLFLLIRNDRFVEEVLDNCTGTSYPAINPTTLGKIKIYVPRDLKEQQAIASVLTAMDEEIQALETEKYKMVQIREGAMDDLLTGRVRLKI